MANRTKAEQETILSYDEAGDSVNIYTFNSKLINKLKKLIPVADGITVLREGDRMIEVIVPKTWIHVYPPRQLSPEYKAMLAQRMQSLHQVTL